MHGAEQLVHHYGLFIAVALIFLTELGVPTGVPNEVILLFAGSYSVHSKLGLAFGFVVVAAADVLGTFCLYWATRTGGVWVTSHVLKKTGRKPEETFERWRGRLHGHDVLVIILGRLMPLVRMSVAIGAGLLKIPARDVIVGVIPGGVFWAGIPLVLGYVFRSHVHQLIRDYERFTHYALIALPIIAVIALAIWYWHRRTRQNQPLKAEG